MTHIGLPESPLTNLFWKNEGAMRRDEVRPTGARDGGTALAREGPVQRQRTARQEARVRVRARRRTPQRCTVTTLTVTWALFWLVRLRLAGRVARVRRADVRQQLLPLTRQVGVQGRRRRRGGRGPGATRSAGARFAPHTLIAAAHLLGCGPALLALPRWIE